MRFTDFITTNQVFTTTDLLSSTSNPSSARVALSRAVKSGRVLKVRTGLYVSQSGRFQDVKADPYLIARTFRPDAVYAYHSALDLHGLAHSISNLTQFMSHSQPTAFTFEGMSYKSLPAKPEALTETLTANAFGSVQVTTREQTLVDCMARIGSSGGAEEVLRSFAGLPYADVDSILLCLKNYPPVVAARIGWYLEANQERWSVPDEALATLEELIPKQASYKLDPTYKRFVSYSSRWNLNIPVSTDEIRDWLEM
jgi:predicted transcriptional regulator of viral defense system